MLRTVTAACGQGTALAAGLRKPVIVGVTAGGLNALSRVRRMHETARAHQSEYYERTAETYDQCHVAPGDEHFIALEYVAGLCETVQASSLLDVGSGTGRAVRFLAERRPLMKFSGIEPSTALREQAILHGGGEYHDGVCETLPFEDDSFDVVLATAVMHHVPHPSVAIAEMQRVARSAVLISDGNRFGQGRIPERLLKLAIRRTGLWDRYIRTRTSGRGYFESEGDGVFYSYSLYDSTAQVSEWATRSFIIPTLGGTNRWLGPLLSASNGLLVGVREPCRPDWAGVVK